jgi:hypothetical protein
VAKYPTKYRECRLTGPEFESGLDKSPMADLAALENIHTLSQSGACSSVCHHIASVDTINIITITIICMD